MPTPTIITLEPILPVQIVAKAFPEVLAGNVDVSVNGTLYDSETAPGAVNIPVTNLDDDSVGVVTPGVGVKVGNSLVLIKKTGGALIESKAVVAEGVAETTIDDSVVVIKDSGGVTLYSKTVKADDVAEQVVNDATVNVRKSDGVLIAAVPVKAQSTEPYNVANSTVTMKDTAGATLDSKSVKATESAEFTAPNATVPIKDSAGSLLKIETFKSGETRDVGISDSVLTLNGGAFLNVKAQASQNIQLLSSVDDSPIVPASVVGAVIKVAPGGATPSGVLLQFPSTPLQYTSYRPGDEGDRAQLSWYVYNPPSTPKVIAELDYSVSQGIFQLKNNLIVGGASNKLRFTDVDGVQTFSATNNKNFALIDKLRGLMFSRLNVSSAAGWNAAIDAALAYSIVINGVTYDDWVLASLQDFFPSYLGSNDGITGVLLWPNGTGFDTWSSTTVWNSTGSAYYINRNTRRGEPLTKTFGTPVPLTLVRKCTDLITAP